MRRISRRPFVRVGLELLEDRSTPAPLFTQLAAQTSTQLNNNGYIHAGDWDKNGTTDIVMTNYGPSTSSPGKTITFGYNLNGDGKFSGYTSLAVGAGQDHVSYLAVGDLNNDGNPDIVTVQTNTTTEAGTMTVFLGSSVGAFAKTAAGQISTNGARASWVGIADFNKDGKQDVAVVNLGMQTGGAADGRTIAIFKGDGAGGLEAFQKIDIPLANGVATVGNIADFNNDTYPDLAVALANVPPDDVSPQVPGSIRVFLNNQDGTVTDFASAAEYGSGGPLPITLDSGDFNGDGTIDLIVGNAGDPDVNGLYANFGRDHSIGTLANAGTGAFGPTTTYTVGFNSAFQVVLRDFNLDGKQDIAVCDIGKPGSILGGGSAPGGLAIYYGKTTGSGFSLDIDSPYLSPSDAPQAIVVGSFNSATDTTPDIVMVHESNSIVTFLNTTTPASPTTTTLTAAPVSPTTYGNNVILTAKVATGAAGTPTGVVSFYSGGTKLGTGTLDGSLVANFTITTPNAAAYTYTAEYDGAAGFASSKSTAISYTVNKAATTTTVVANPTSANAGTLITISATVGSGGGTPGGTVNFFDGATQIGSGTLADSGGQQKATMTTSTLAVGGHSITAKFAGSSNFDASTSGSTTVTINSPTPLNTTTLLTVTPNPFVFGDAILMTATVSAAGGTPGGTVNFFDNGVQIGSGTLSNNGGQMQATFSTSLAAGAHSMSAQYVGITGFNPSTSNTVSVQGNNATSTTTLSVLPNPVDYSTAVTMKATVAVQSGTPTGTVTFFDGAVQIGSPVALINNAGQYQAAISTAALLPGTHAITAVFSGSTGQTGSTSAATDLTVNFVSTTTAVSPAPTTLLVGSPVTITATISPAIGVTDKAGGTVTFRNNGTSIGTGTVSTVAGQQVATLTTSALPAGTNSITAVYGGDTIFNQSTSPAVTVTVNQPASGLVGYREFGTGAGAGNDSTARFFNPDGSLRFQQNIFPGFTGGVRVTSADFNNDGVADLVAGTGPGQATQVVVLDGKSQAVLTTISPFEAAFTGGVFVAAGDIDGDGTADLAITPDEGGGPRARIFSGKGFAQIDDFFGIEDPAFRGGARAAIADVTGDGKGDLLVAAGFGGGPRLATWSGVTLGTGNRVKPFADFFMFEQSLRNGIYIAGGDLNGDGNADLIAGGGPGGGPRVYALSGKDMLSGVQSQLANFFAGDTSNRGGIRLVARDLDGDARADLVVGAGTGAGTRVTGYLGKNIPNNGDPTGQQFSLEAYPGFQGGVFVG
jgi:hypothetical protein